MIASREAIKGIIVGSTLFTLAMGSGGFAILNYAATIFRDSGSDINPNVSSIFTASVQLIGCVVMTFLIDKLGRKLLLIISTTGMGIGYTILGIYSYMNLHGYDTSSYFYIPIISLSFTIFVGCIGVCTIPFVMLSEVVPLKIRSQGSIISLTAYLISGTIILGYFPILVDTLELYGCVWLFAGICFAGNLFIILVVSETNGKNLVTQ